MSQPYPPPDQDGTQPVNPSHYPPPSPYPEPPTQYQAAPPYPTPPGQYQPAPGQYQPAPGEYPPTQYPAPPGYYPTQQYPAPVPPPSVNGFAVASLILGICSGPLLAAIFGII